MATLCPMSLFKKQKRRYHPIPPPSRHKEKPSFLLSNYAPFLLFALRSDNRPLSELRFTPVGAPFLTERGRQRFRHEIKNSTFWELRQVSQEPELEPLLLQAQVVPVPQQVLPPLWLLVLVPPWLCTQFPSRQY